MLEENLEGPSTRWCYGENPRKLGNALETSSQHPSDLADSSSAYSLAGSAATGQAPEIHTNPALEYVAEPTSESSWRVTTKMTRKVQRVRLSTLQDAPKPLLSTQPLSVSRETVGAASKQSEEETSAANGECSDRGNVLQVCAREDATEVIGPWIEGAAPSGPELWVVRA